MQSRATTAEGLRPVYVWQIPVRITHWLIFFSVAVLAVTGIYIGNPFLISAGPATERFVMGWMKAIHFYAAIVFTLSVLSRLLWMFRGNRWASWRQFLPVERHRRQGIVGTLKFYLFVNLRPPEYTGHNPLAGATYALVFGLYFVLIGTGLGLYSIEAHVGSPLQLFSFFVPLFGGAQSARFIHHVFMWLLLGFAVHHVFSALLVDRVERNGVLTSIFSGFKFLRADAAGEERERS